MINKKREEVENLNKATKEALIYFNKFNRKKLLVRESFFLMLHKTILASEPKIAGRYRSSLHELDIGGKTFTPSPAWQIENKIIDLIDFINNKRKWRPIFRKLFLNLIKSNNTLTKKQHELVYKIFIAWYLHHNFVVIHPFANGNGRTARLLMCLILRYEGLSKVSYPILINYIINQDKSKYLNALNATDRGDYVSGVNYMFEVLDKAYRETTKKTKINSY